MLTNQSDAPQNNNLEILVSDVERDLMFEIIMNMKHRRISIAEAHYLSQDFLKLLPVQDKEELLKKLKELGDNYAEARAVFLKYSAPNEEEKRLKLLNAMRKYLKSGEIEKAIEVAKGGTYNAGG